MTILRCAALRASAPDDHEGESITLSKRDAAEFADYVKHLAVRMRLAEYDPLIMPHACEGGYLAEVETDFSYHTIRIALCPGFHVMSPTRKRTTLVHELLHAHAYVMKVPYEALEDELARGVWATTESTAMKHEEHVVTSMESAFAQFMPLPPKIERRRK